VLRRFIDDSINALSELEFNHHRIEDGLLPVSLAWPWGQGMRVPLPNLALTRGEPVWVESGSMRLAGLTRLCCYLHGDWRDFGRGTALDFERLSRHALNRDVSITVLDSWTGFEGESREEEAAWLASEFDRRFIEPIMDDFDNVPTRFVLLAPRLDGEPGIGLWVETRHNPEMGFPFDERLLEDKRPPIEDAWTVIDRALRLKQP
jgi:hypothetical protein